MFFDVFLGASAPGSKVLQRIDVWPVAILCKKYTGTLGPLLAKRTAVGLAVLLSALRLWFDSKGKHRRQHTAAYLG